jgi:rhomboid protease GluP
VQDPTARDDRPAWLREPHGGAEQDDADQRVPAGPPSGPEAGPGGPGPGGPRRAPATRLPTPYVTWAILAVNTLMLIVIGVRSGGGIGFVDPNGAVLCQLGALNATAIAEHGQWWRLLTVMVLHGGVIHFALNSWALWLFGPTLEFVLGRARFLALYVVSGLAGSAASFALGHTEIGVGASGAIFGLLGALVAFFWRRRNMGAGGQLRSLLLVLLINLIWGASQRGGIDLIAHLGGFVAGLLAMGLLEVAAPRGRAAASLALAVPAVLSLLLVGWGVANFTGGLIDCANLPPGVT